MKVLRRRNRFTLFPLFLVALALASCAQSAGVGSMGSGDVSQFGDQMAPAKESGWSSSLPSLGEYVPSGEMKEIYFEFDKSILTHQSVSTLIKNVEWFKKQPSALVLVEGHADERGTNEYNLALGERRAKAARDFMVSLGISNSRISQISYGEERPVCNESTEGCWAKNRRDHFLVKMK